MLSNKKEMLLRLILINTILQQYKVGELTKNAQTFRKQVKKALLKVSCILGEKTTKEVIATAEQIWSDAFEVFKDRSLLASTFITGLYREEMFAKYINVKYFEKYLIHSMNSHTDREDKVEVETYEIEEYFNVRIEEIKNV